MPLREVFVSHANRDRETAERIVRVLNRHGIPTWFSKEQLIAAQDWHDEIGAALERCNWFLLLLTPQAVESMWVKRELQFALRQERLAGRIVCVLVRAMRLHEALLDARRFSAHRLQ